MSTPQTGAPPPAAGLGPGIPKNLTSTTAPGKIFPTRPSLAEHYKSDWHRYNLKRREAGLPMLRETDFNKRLEAALALRKEREGREERSGTDHLKNKDDKGKKGKKERREEKHTAKALTAQDASAAAVGRAYYSVPKPDATAGDEHMASPSPGGESQREESQQPMDLEEEPPNIDPLQSLFDSHTSPDIRSNLRRMHHKYGFFVPDKEYLTDLTGFIGYCHEKVKLGHYCLYCHKVYKTYGAAQRHMVDARHCKVRYERGVDQEEFDVFYDFGEADRVFLESGGGKGKGQGADGTGEEGGEVVREGEGDDDDDSGEWEDISDDGDDAEMGEEDDDDMYEGYETEIKSHGFDITPLGELIFPDGRIVGHRALSRYYKQQFVPDGERAAVSAARRAAGERVYGGRVHDIRNPAAGAPATTGDGGGGGGHGDTLALARAGLVAGAAAGRSGHGILVSSSGGGGGGGSHGGNFTALSLYRYRAATRKAKRDDAAGYRQRQRTENNINRMDKKANRLMNGVSVAHAAR